MNLLWFGQALATAEALLLGRRAGIEPDLLRGALAGSAAASTFITRDLGALLDDDYLASFELDRCCEELSAVAGLAPELGTPSDLTQLVEQTYQRALRRYGPASGELLGVALLEGKPASGCAMNLPESDQARGRQLTRRLPVPVPELKEMCGVEA